VPDDPERHLTLRQAHPRDPRQARPNGSHAATASQAADTRRARSTAGAAIAEQTSEVISSLRPR
jgi:hypothetical protein